MHPYMGGDADFQILSSITDAAAGSHTGKVLARRVGESLRHLFPEMSVELVWLDEVDGASERSFSFDGEDVRESVRPLTRAGHPEADGVSIEDNGRRLAARVPMRVLERVTGYALFEFDRTLTPVPPSKATLELLGRILGFGQSHCRLVERMARLSA